MEGHIRDLLRQKIVDAQARPLPPFTRRDVRLPAVRGKAVAVVGMRRSGKTTFLWQLLADRVAAGTPREGLLYLGFEDERLLGMTAAQLGMVVEEYYQLHPEWRDKRRATFFLDEIQVVPGWETFARRLLDTERIDLFLSGSSAKLLSREVATSMRGRAMEALVHPFSFREALRHAGDEPDRPWTRLPKAERSRVGKALGTWLQQGGFPEAQGVPARDRRELLKSYVDVVLLRDVIERHQVSHPVALLALSRQLLGNASGLFSVNKFYNDLRSQGIPISKDTLHAYLGHLEDAFLVRTLSVASRSERRRMVNPRKVYPIDMGLIPVFARSGEPELGRALETAVMIELGRRGAEVAYVRTEAGLEVDFLACFPGGGELLIQVCANLDDPETRERETRALLAARAEHRKAGLLLITGQPEIPAGLPPDITVSPAAEWLLTAPDEG